MTSDYLFPIGQAGGLIELSSGQYELIYNLLSFTIATFGAAFVYFLATRNRLPAKYSGAVLVSAIVVGIAGYHYIRIFESFQGATAAAADGGYLFNGALFNDAYRYVDWLLTVPLLLVELVAVLALTRSLRDKLLFKLILASVAMLLLGYPGEISSDNDTRALWGALSTIPFLYILYVLWIELGKVIQTETARVRVLVRNTRLLLLATWGFYPIAYMAPMLGLDGGSALTAIQVGYSIADLTAKAGYGLMIVAIAFAKARAEGSLPTDSSHGDAEAAAASSA
jgi:bacteriorhodopsin